MSDAQDAAHSMIEKMADELRGYDASPTCRTAARMLIQQFDRITELEAEVERLRQALDDYGDLLNAEGDSDE